MYNLNKLLAPIIRLSLSHICNTHSRNLHLFFTSDPGSSVPAEIRARGPRAEHAFQKAMQTGKVKVYRGRIMLLGQDRAGKTSLRKSLLSLPFDPKQESTVGIEVDEVKNWMLCKKGEVSELKDEIARFIVRDLNKREADDNGSTYPNVGKMEV